MIACKFSGFSLVELLVSMALSGILVIAITATFGVGAEVGKTQEGVSSRVENEMLLGQMIKRDMQNVDAWRCYSSETILPKVSVIKEIFHVNATASIWGEDNINASTKLIDGSDVLYLMTAEKMVYMEDVAGDSSIVVSAAEIAKNDKLLMTDCLTVQLNKVDSVKMKGDESFKLKLNTALSDDFIRSKVQVYKLIFKRYSLQKGINDSALFLSVNHKKPIELLSGIASFQLEYAVDTVSVSGDFIHQDVYTADEMDSLALWPQLRQVLIRITPSTLTKKSVEFSFSPGFSR